jgi:hypothetical protein
MSFINQRNMIENNLERNNRFYDDIHDRIDKANTRYSLLVIIFGIILTQFTESGLAILMDNSLVWYSLWKISVIIGTLIFIYSTWRFINFIWPREVAYKGLPKKIYDNVYNEYLNKRGKSHEEALKLTKYSELELLENANNKNYKLYKKKRANYFHSLTSAILCLAFLTPSFMFIQVEKFNKTQNEKTNQGHIMSNEEENKPDPKEIIIIEPEMIKEGTEKPAQNKSDSANNNGDSE